MQIPVKGPRRICTTVAKVERFERWLNDHFPGEVADVWIGFETGEEKRALRGDPFSQPTKPKAGESHRVNYFPLIHGARPMLRRECANLIEREGFHVPTKSSCMYCMYGKEGPWREFLRRFPDHFARIERLEERKLARPTGRGYRLSIQGWGRYTLTPSMHRALLKLLKAQRYKRPVDHAGLRGGEKRSFAAMEKRDWVFDDGKLTNYGADILREAGRTPIRAETEAEKKEQGEIVWRAATKHGDLPVPGVHYVFVPIGEYAACKISDEEEAWQDAQAQHLVIKTNPEVRRLRNRLLR